MKHMKKSMFITTLAMVVVLVVALSTATFAWYTAQTSANVTSTTVTSANSSTASLVIDTATATDNMANNSSIDLTMSGPIVPLIYDSAADPVKGTTTYTDFTGDFVTFTIDNAGKYASVPAASTPSVINTVTSTASPVTQPEFYVTNVGGAATGVTASIVIDPVNYVVFPTVVGETVVDGKYTYDGVSTYTAVSGSNVKAAAETTYYSKIDNNFLRIAMFIDGKYVGTWTLASNNQVKRADYTGAASDVKEVGDTLITHTYYTAEGNGTNGNAVNVKASLGSMTGMKVQLVAWFEGDSQNNSYSGTAANFTISFGTVAAANP